MTLVWCESQDATATRILQGHKRVPLICLIIVNIPGSVQSNGQVRREHPIWHHLAFDLIMLSRAALYAVLFATCTITSTNAAGYATRDPTTPVCSGFTTLTNTSHVSYSDANRVISSGVVCNTSNVSTSCSVLSGGWSELYNYVSFANGTQITDQRYAVGWTMWNSTGDSRAVYDTAGYGAMENETVTFDQGTSGWVVFTPEYRCINGLIRNCPANFTLANDTEVRVCYPMFTDRSVAFESTTGHFENISIIAGQRFINETSVSAATQLKENPNNRPPYGLSSGDAAKMFIGFGGVLGLVVFWVGTFAL
ncbi:hypothetical protein AUEXF2481DRAFT_84079 [Aureobasidium subglaciale EXF-2481]|uniref:Uncharacterized protein n=1 Tax=Aureobasidium subglaciale (strain EXF-2481) TaxID=1043005 RepID=A0A074Y2V6_AURSE|nr:uncharacterized protein AUEXF2481DRAFT_84079 [Aureobasidium subglaciale EXF-2481]KEQ90264.1 hypothetical protein AUEXF2481DRAFT_84079 [Aureobasidium subglaciale EXF-2481]